MSAVAASAADIYATHLKNSRLGLWLFFVSELFLFGGLLAARFYLWNDPEIGTIRPDLDQNIGLAVTVILLISSWSMNMAETGMEHDDRRVFSIGMISTFILGLLFLLGVMIFEWGLITIRGALCHDRDARVARGEWSYLYSCGLVAREKRSL